MVTGRIQEAERPTLSWAPVLRGQELRLADRLISDASSGLLTHARSAFSHGGMITAHRASLGVGHAGLVVALAYLHLAGFHGCSEAAVEATLNRTIDLLGHRVSNLSLFWGATGVAWAVEHVRRVLGWECDDPNDEFDCLLLDSVEQSPETCEHDLVSGLAGVGVYALERLPRPSARACAEYVVHHLSDVAREQKGEVFWPHLLRNADPRGTMNVRQGLGMAHGVAGLIALLAALHRANILRSVVAQLIEGSVRRVLRMKGWDCARPPIAEPPSWSWSWGDTGIIAALLSAARALQRADWEIIARARARSLSSITGRPGVVLKTSMCHGAAGIGHIYNRLYHVTGDLTLRHCARRMLLQAMLHGGLSATRQRGGHQRATAPAMSSLLYGVPGVVLAVLSAARGLDPGWDRVFLPSAPSS